MAEASGTALVAPEELERRAAAARLQRLAAATPEDLAQLEAELRAIVEATKQGTKQNGDARYRVIRDAARQRLVLLLAQAGRDEEANAMLKKAGYVARLSPAVLNYPPPPARDAAGSDDDSAVAAPAIAIDDAVARNVLARLDAVFAAPDAAYWRAHGYSVEPPSPYFSYTVPIDAAVRDGAGLGALGAMIRGALRTLARLKGEEAVAKARYAELWAHNRPHASGHQMHFDSDDEGRGGVRNPIASGVLYLTTGVGGPTVVTTQKLGDAGLAAHGWAAHPQRGRMVLFDGRVLHGVVPGKGLPDSGGDGSGGVRRVTVMVALWEDVRIRDDEPGPGSSRPLPAADDAAHAGWTAPLVYSALADGPEFDPAAAAAPPAPLAPLVPVWCDVAGRPWPTGAGARMPPYEKAFQGF